MSNNEKSSLFKTIIIHIGITTTSIIKGTMANGHSFFKNPQIACVERLLVVVFLNIHTNRANNKFEKVLYMLEHWITSTPVMLKPSMAAFHQYIILRIMNKNPWRDTQWKWDISPQWIPQRNFIQIMAMRCSRYSKNGEKKITFLLILYFNEIRSPNKFDLFHVCLK